MADIRLGKISRVKFGYGGYQESMLGLDLEFSGSNWSCVTFEGFWRPLYCQSGWIEGTRWTKNDLSSSFTGLINSIDSYLTDAKVMSVDKLLNIPVEVTFDDGVLKSWRILKEVL